MIAPLSKEWIGNMNKLVLKPLLDLKEARKDFMEEAKTDYRYAVKKAMVDYVLLDGQEQERLGVPMPDKVHESVHLNVVLINSFAKYIF